MVLMIPLMGMSLAIPMVESMGAAIDDPGLGLALPGWGALYAARGLQGMLSPAWVGVTLACQVLWGLMALRFATWLFALEDDALGDLRRRLGGLRRAP